MYYIKQGFVCSRLSEPQWPLKFGRHSHFKGLLVLVIYNFVAVVELLAAMLRVRTQERVCGPKGNMLVCIKCLWPLPNKGWGEKWITDTYLYCVVFFYPSGIGNKITMNKYLILVRGLQHWAKTFVQQPNSASDDFSKLPYRRRQVINTFPFGAAVDRSILDKQDVSSIFHPVAAVWLFFFFSANPKVVSLNTPVPLF